MKAWGRWLESNSSSPKPRGRGELMAFQPPALCKKLPKTTPHQEGGWTGKFNVKATIQEMKMGMLLYSMHVRCMSVYGKILLTSVVLLPWIGAQIIITEYFVITQNLLNCQFSKFILKQIHLKVWKDSVSYITSNHKIIEEIQHISFLDCAVQDNERPSHVNDVVPEYLQRY